MSLTQKQIIRTVTFKGKYGPTDTSFDDLGILEADLLLKYFMMLSIHKNINISEYNNNIFLGTP